MGFPLILYYAIFLMGEFCLHLGSTIVFMASIIYG